jgi:hypothetical protein
MTIHDLKCRAEPFAAVVSGAKTHEIRKADRPFEVGDVLHLREWEPFNSGADSFNSGADWVKPAHYTGRSIRVEVAHISRGGTWGLPADLCVMSIRRIP